MDFTPQNAPLHNAPDEDEIAVAHRLIDAEQRPEKWRRTKILWAGFAASSFVGLFSVVIVPRLLEALSSMFVPRGQDTFITVLGASTFIAIPLSMGAVSVWVWKPLKLDKGSIAGYTYANSIIASLGSAFVLREGAICLLMAHPILACVLLLGAWMGDTLWNKINKPLQMSLLPLFALCLFVDINGKNVTSEVTTEMTIRASPAQVWQSVNHFPPIRNAPDYWLFKIGMPMPIVSRLSAEKVGAKRECILTGDLAFEEKVTVWKPREQLTFDVTKQPHHPELTGHFKLLRGEFRLRDNKNGTTTLIGTSWYKLNVRPLWYWQLWSDDVIRHIHLRVMNHIRDEAEQASTRAS